MSSSEAELLCALETHDAEALHELLASGVDARALVQGRSLVQWLLEMYFRSDRFPLCLRALLTHGAVLESGWLEPVLLDDEEALRGALRRDSELVRRRASLRSAFTPLDEATALHVACEHGNLRAARVLLEHGALVDARAGLDGREQGGHTPLFHTVSSNANRSAPLMELLLAHGADPSVRVAGLIWGRGFEWETALFDLTPISYALFGLLPQMHRDEVQIYANVRRLLVAGGRDAPASWNVPNRYLHPQRPG
ncbi:MAG: ankyrin repeat domain-containing protein [Planctomycetes bacterium]|nr:ankyrin repeat domain-containing protein [Planctomycetota bacterium]